ncbi:hypothetical protein EYF80_036328 [Liparis tanakae]|uniref:Uncharacterized protein n=1 Tax=Liparis tanakae TaxID=230148 RepID=A0A4Z2GJ52_9TELE|nr:hypothetical protein EYF80_036328 [Liparis tanakae]
MHHVEVAVQGEGDEEGDAGAAVEEQHEEHRLAQHFVGAAPLAVVVVVGLGRETGHQQEVSNHDVEQEDAFVLPELEPEGEVANKQQRVASLMNYKAHLMSPAFVSLRWVGLQPVPILQTVFQCHLIRGLKMAVSPHAPARTSRQCLEVQRNEPPCPPQMTVLLRGGCDVFPVELFIGTPLPFTKNGK